jgi:hypothetical protein
MKKQIILILLAFTSVICCKAQILDNCTTIEEIFKLNKGMSFQTVSNTLGVQPYEFYVNFENGNKVVVYRYMKQYQEVASKDVNARKGLTGGKEKFKGASDLYVVFDTPTGEMLFYITDLGREKAGEILGSSNQLKLIKEDPIKFKGEKKKKEKEKAKVKIFGFF